MNPDNTNAQDKAVEALIAAGLRAPDQETEVTQDQIDRYVQQHVTLNSEDKAALDKSKPHLMEMINSVLQGNEQEAEDHIARPSGAERSDLCIAMNRKNSTDEFSALTESELDRKRKEMLQRLKKNQGNTGL